MDDLTCDIDSFLADWQFMSVRHSSKKFKNVARSRVSRLLQTVSRYISRDKYRDASMHR